MSQVKGSLISTSASSSSRLSPLAPPFSIKTSGHYESASPYNHQGSAFGTSHSFPQLSLDAFPHNAYHSDAMSIAVIPFRDFDPISDFHGEAIEDYTLYSDFTWHDDDTSQASIGNAACGSGSGDSIAYGTKDQQGKSMMSFSKEKNASVPVVGYTLHEKGLYALQGLQHSGKEPTALHGTGNFTVTGFNQICSKDTDRRNSRSSCPPFHSKAYSLSNSSELSLSAALNDAQGCLSYPNPVANWSYCDSNFISKESSSKHMDSCGTKLTAFHAPQYCSSLATGLSGSSIKSSIFDPVSAVNKDSGGTIEACVLGKARITVKHFEEVKTEQPFRNEVSSPSSRESSELQVSVACVINELALESQGSKARVALDKPSSLNNHNDSDLDSPCWKGKEVYHSPFQESEPSNSQVSKHETVARNSLNPLAPQFFPVKAKQKADESQNTYQGCNSFSFQKNANLAAVVSSRKETMSPVRAGTSQTEGNNGSSQPYLMKEHSKPNILALSGEDVDNFLNNISDLAHDRLSNSLSLNVTESLKSPSSGVDIFSCFAERSEGLSKSKSNIDAESLINVMLDLSKFLLLNFSNVNRFNESEHDKVQNIIDNLHVYTRNRAEACRFPMSDSGHVSSSYGPTQSADYYEEMLNSISRSGNERMKSGRDYVCKISEIARKGSSGNEEKMHPEALMYRKLWLETVSALSFIKNKYDHHLQQLET